MSNTDSTDKPLIAEYSLGFSISNTFANETDQLKMTQFLQHAADQARDRLEAEMLGIHVERPIVEPVKISLRQRLRQWLANKLHVWSLKLDPTLLDDYYY